MLDAFLPDFLFARHTPAAPAAAPVASAKKAGKYNSAFAGSLLPTERQPGTRPPLPRSAAYNNYFGPDHGGADALAQAGAARIPASTAQGATAEWVGVDLDGTLAMTTEWRGFEHIGPPVPLMLSRVLYWLGSGVRVKIFTARAAHPDAIPPIRRWLAENGLPATLEITNAKDLAMLELWDDRAIQVVQDTGRPFLSTSITGRPKAPILPNEAEGETYFLAPSQIPRNTMEDDDDES
jgi:hypothetical protein